MNNNNLVDYQDSDESVPDSDESEQDGEEDGDIIGLHLFKCRWSSPERQCKNNDGNFSQTASIVEDEEEKQPTEHVEKPTELQKQIEHLEKKADDPEKQKDINEDNDYDEEEQEEEQEEEDDDDDDDDDDDTTGGRTFKVLKLPRTELGTELKALLKEVKVYFTKKTNLERPSPAIALTTIAKIEERLLCFLGYVRKHTSKTLTQKTFFNPDVIEKYVDFLREKRKLNPSTISNHVGALTYVVKYVHRSSGPTYSDVPLVQRLRTLSTTLQREGDQLRPRTKEELRVLNKWLDWEEVLQALESQRTKLDLTVDALKKAHEFVSLLIIAFYCHLPPSRGVEVRCLEYAWEGGRGQEEEEVQDRLGQENLAYLKKDGSVLINVKRYKNAKFHGADQVDLQSSTELARLIRDYAKTHRQHIAGKDSGSSLLLNHDAKQFTCAGFTSRIKRLFVCLTGVSVSINMLRSSFVTYCYDRSDCTDTLKDSLAASLRHSREQAQSTYDRRTHNTKKAAAMEFTRTMAEDFADAGGSGSQSAAGPPARGAAKERKFKPGDFVACVQEGSTLSKPLIFVGRVQFYVSEDSAVSLLWYRRKTANGFCAEFDGEQWTEREACLAPVQMSHLKGKSGFLSLRTSTRSIHKALGH